MKPIIDISAWQPPSSINYDRLANEVSGVILRVAYGTRADIHFATHYREFRARNIPVGAYHIADWTDRRQYPPQSRMERRVSDFDQHKSGGGR